MRIKVEFIININDEELEVLDNEVIENIIEDINEDYEGWIEEIKVNKI